MPSEFVNTVIKSNLSTWYLLPLIYLNKPSFGQGNFIESYVNLDGTMLQVEVISLHLCHPDCIKSPCLLLQSEPAVGYSRLLYRLPTKWQKDFQAFKAGKYSQFSDKAKQLIRDYSGLAIHEYHDGEYITDARIYALDKSPILREAWENELDLLPLPADLELMPVPSARTYREYIHL